MKKVSKPQYPTKEGIWSKKIREEKKFRDVKLGMPYSAAIENFRGAIRERDDFDPAVLLVWGTMQATGVLNILKAVEEAFGPEGQEVARKAINSAGYEAVKGLIENSEFPDGLDEIEFASFALTGINTILYASLEKPWIAHDRRCEFDILWCPHQDIYTAFDCRVQRYFVEGMIQYLEESEDMRMHPIVDKLIPMGAECCHFIVDKMDDDGERHPWHSYSDQLGKRAFDKMKKDNS